MSEKHIHVSISGVGAQAGTVRAPLFRVPATHGGITITGAYMKCGAAATSVLTLCTGTALGTASTGTAGTLNGTFVANVPQAFDIDTAYVDAGKWLLLETGAGGSLSTVSEIIVEYVWGK